MDTLDAEEREYAEKYVKMAKAGLPVAVVEHKMVAEGMPGYIQSAVKEAIVQQEATASPPPPTAAVAETPQRTNVVGGGGGGDESMDEETLEETVEEEVTAHTTSEEELVTEEEEVTATEEYTDHDDDQQQLHQNQQHEVFDDEEYEEHDEEIVEETTHHQESNGSGMDYATPEQNQQNLPPWATAPPPQTNDQQQQDYYGAAGGGATYVGNGNSNYTNTNDPEMGGGGRRWDHGAGNGLVSNEQPGYGLYATNPHNKDPPEQRQSQPGGLKRPNKNGNNTASNQPQQTQSNKIQQARRRKCMRSVLILIVLAFILTLCGLGVLIYFWLADDDDNGDDAAVARTNGTTAPTPPTVTGPTAAPTPGPLVVDEAQAFSGPQGSLSGTDVASSGAWIAVGQPADGTVVLSQRPSNGAFVERATLSSPAGVTSEFGASVDFTGVVSGNPYLIIGAPRVPLGTSTFAGGAAYYYAYVPNQQMWVQQGEAIQGGLTLDNLEEAFGTAVAASDNNRVVIGAPTYGEDKVGRVYTYEWDGTLWNPMSAIPLVGTPDSLFGSAVDITADGSTIAAGQPADSIFRIYNWNAVSSLWLRSYELVLASVVDLGSDIKFLSRNYLAVGAPSAADGAGVVLVFEREGGAWSLLGQITGQDGQGIGAKGTVDGAEGSDGPELVIGTATGFVERYDWFNQTSFKQRFSENVGAPVTSVDLTSEGNYGIVVGLASADKAVLLEAEGVAARDTPLGSSPPTPSPTFAPTSTNNFRTAGGPFTVTGGGGFGTAVAWAGDLLAAGMPLLNGKDGAVQSYEFTTQADELALVEFTGTQEFGGAIDMVIESGGQVAMLVGAHETDDSVYITAFGAAYYYLYDGSEWTLIGGEMRGDLNDLAQTGGDFGKALAMASSIRRVAIAAPDASTFATNDLGLIYTFDFDGTDWVESATVLQGDQVDEFMGTSLDMNANGSRLLVGSPGFDSGNGRFQIFSYDSGAWTQVFEEMGANGSSFGTVAAMLNDEGTEFAVGGSGVIEVFEEVGTNAFAAKGGQLPGDVVCGAAGRLGVGTSAGLLTVYEFTDGGFWTDISGAVDTGAAVVSCALSSDGLEIVVGLDSLEVRVYTF